MSDLPPGWAEAELGHICEVILGQSPPGATYNTLGEGVAFFQGKAEFGPRRPTVAKWTTAGRKFASPDDVLLSVRAPVGPVNLSPAHCAIGRGLAALHPLGGIDVLFVLLLLQSSAQRLADSATGTTFPAVSGSQVRSHQVSVPPLAEQERIVATIEEQFSRLDAADASLHRARRRLRLLRDQSIALAVDGGWPIVALAAVTSEQSYGSSAKAAADIPGGVAILRMGNIVEGQISYDRLKYLSPDHPDVGKFELRPGDLLFNRTNSPDLVGKSAVFHGGLRCTFASYLIRVRLTDGCDPRWAALVINGPAGRTYVAEVRTQQVGQANVNGTKLAALPMPLPPRAEQQRIVAEVERRLSIIDAMAAEIDLALKRSAQLRRSILDRAFRGTLVPQDPNDEPASVLLERIRAERPAKAPRRRPRA